MSAVQLDISYYAKPERDATLGLDLAVDGVTCGACIGRIEGALKQLPGIVDARLNYTNRRLHVAWTEGALKPARILDALAEQGYRGHPLVARRAEQEEAAEARRLTRCMAVAGFAAMNIMLLSVSVWSGNATDIMPETRDFFHWASALIALPAAAYAGRPFFASARHALRARSVNMDVPISLGVILALGVSLVETANHAREAYFDSAIMLLFFLLVGRTLDHAMRRKTREVAGNLAALRAETANRFEADAIVTVPVAAVQAKDSLLVRPGERIPADGTVLTGQSDLDESLITGETARREVAAGAAIYAGSLNYSGTLTLLVTAVSGASVLDDIEKLLDKALSARSKVMRLADRATRIYAPVVHTSAALTALGWLASGASLHDAIITAISVLIITCPCALALAIPAVQVVASGALFRSNVILTSGDALERLADVDTIIFDKTGTLTLPEPRVLHANVFDPVLLQIAARLALSSRHPLAAALAHEATPRIPFDGAMEEPGRGVRAVVDGSEARLGSAEFCAVSKAEEETAASHVYLSHQDKVARFAIAQRLRPDAVEVVSKLRALGLHLEIRSGDRADAVQPIAEELGISNWTASLKPAGKIAEIERLKAEGRRVLMVGDGLNDAPSLAAAHVSLAPISAADLTQAQADAVFLGEKLAPVLTCVTAGRRARKLMRENLWLAAIYNLFAVPFAVAGFVTPLIAALAMSGSSLMVTLNALRARA
jgi:P-type Cu2+ transporter